MLDGEEVDGKKKGLVRKSNNVSGSIRNLHAIRMQISWDGFTLVEKGILLPFCRHQPG